MKKHILTLIAVVAMAVGAKGQDAWEKRDTIPVYYWLLKFDEFGKPVIYWTGEKGFKVVDNISAVYLMTPHATYYLKEDKKTLVKDRIVIQIER